MTKLMATEFTNARAAVLSVMVAAWVKPRWSAQLPSMLTESELLLSVSLQACSTRTESIWESQQRTRRMLDSYTGLTWMDS
jgi:hypothetical protein